MALQRSGVRSSLAPPTENSLRAQPAPVSFLSELVHAASDILANKLGQLFTFQVHSYMILLHITRINL